MDETGANSRLDTPEFRETLQFYSDLILKSKVSPPISDPANDSKPVDDFYAGTVAMMNSGPWDFIKARTRAKFNWDVTLFPKGKAGNYTNVQGSGFTVSSKSKYKQEAYQALTVITGTEGLSVLAKSGRAFPARASAVPAFYVTTRAPANAKIIEKAGTTVQRYRVTPTWFDVLPIMNKEIDNVLVGQKPSTSLSRGQSAVPGSGDERRAIVQVIPRCQTPDRLERTLPDPVSDMRDKAHPRPPMTHRYASESERLSLGSRLGCLEVGTIAAAFA